MSTICELTPPQHILEMYSSWDDKERTYLDSPPPMEGLCKEDGNVIVTLDSLEKRQRAKRMPGFRKTVKKCHCNRLGEKRVHENWQFFKEATRALSKSNHSSTACLIVRWWQSTSWKMMRSWGVWRRCLEVWGKLQINWRSSISISLANKKTRLICKIMTVL